MTSTEDITKATFILRSGGLVAFPTETVYGLGADASNQEAVRKIFWAKERPYDHPLIVHIAKLDQLTDWAREVSPEAMALAHAFWPGPLTMIFKKQAHVLDVITGGQDTVGLRMPRHPIAQMLLQDFGKGVAAPSANKFTHISPTTAAAVQDELGDRVDMILDGGTCEVGLESTIIDMSHQTPTILRPGMISAQAIATVLGRQIPSACKDGTKMNVPGMHHLHYAPTTKTILIDTRDIADFVRNLPATDLPIALMHHSDLLITNNDKVNLVKMPKQADGYAHDLYHTLRELDQRKLKRIVIESVPQHSEWDAIRDRLSKASARKIS